MNFKKINLEKTKIKKKKQTKNYYFQFMKSFKINIC